jgi:exodeoxyribonuclease V gamma subunit
MSITLRVAASLDLLSDALTEDMRADFTEKRIGVFDPQWVVTQTDGINSWMKNQLAEKTGIAANLRFVKMNDIVQLLYAWLFPKGLFLMDKDRMTWTIFAVLNEDQFINQYPSIASYYSGSELRRIALATEMADLFDQYQIYRHDKIEKWNQAEFQVEESLRWQVYLWKKIKERLGEAFNKPEKKELISKRLPYLRFFGMAIVTPYFLELFRVLSTIIEVKFYLLNPSPDEYWIDNEAGFEIDKRILRLRDLPSKEMEEDTGNELLNNWGTVLKDSYKLLLTNESYVNVYDVIPSDRFSDHPFTLLKQIQYEIYTNQSNQVRQAISNEMLKDGSFVIQGCFTPVREVEVFYNYMIDSFAANPALKARDVVVMVTDIDTYAPFIRAVFDNAPVKIPYSIADETVSKGNTLFTAIRDILSINAETFKSEEVLSLLDSPYIRNRFGFTDIIAVRQAVREAGIFLGKGVAADDPELYERTEAWMVSWDYGLQKIMYGLCMSGGEMFTVNDRELLPLDTAEGAGMLDRIRLYDFVQVLMDILGKRSSPKTLTQWSEYLGEIMTSMIIDEEKEDEDLIRFAQLQETIAELDEVSGGSQISFLVFRQVFFSRLEEERRINRYAGPGINFCTLLPMRSVPYKIVALMGMDFENFPRQDSALSFSLLRHEKRFGDRSIRENDKHLFLESLVAAREKFYISYVARNVQKGTEMPPSTLVDELMDYIAIKTSAPADYKKSAVCMHPLHVFSAQYLGEQSSLPSNYLSHNYVRGKDYEIDPDRNIPLPDFKFIQLDKFGEFFKNPVKYYYNNQLDIYYREEEERIPETELFELEFLQEWKIKDDFLRGDYEPAEYTDQQKRSGQLPLSNMGKAWVNKILQEISEFNQAVNDLRSGEQKREISVRYHYEDSDIEGVLPVYGNDFVFFAYTKSGLKNILKPWVLYLVALASDENASLNFIYVYNIKEETKINGKAKTVQKPFVSQIPYSDELRAYAAKTVPVLLEKFIAGHTRPFLFYPEMAYVISPENKDDVVSCQWMIDLYENDMEEHYPKIFTDAEYLGRMIEDNKAPYAVFSDQYIVEWINNTFLLTDKLRELLPDVFNLPD